MLSICLTGDQSVNEQTQWDFVLTHWIIDEIFVLGEVTRQWTSKPLTKANFINTADALPKRDLVVMSPLGGRYYQGEKSLIDFIHPTNAIYLFGSNHTHLSTDQMGSRVPDHLVYIPTENHHEMYAWVAAAITLYDRKVKRG